jgi:hypothetical protein
MGKQQTAKEAKAGNGPGKKTGNAKKATWKKHDVKKPMSNKNGKATTSSPKNGATRSPPAPVKGNNAKKVTYKNNRTAANKNKKGDWISSLVTQSVTMDAKAETGTASSATAASKTERDRKRQEKKEEREEKKRGRTTMEEKGNITSRDRQTSSSSIKSKVAQQIVSQASQKQKVERLDKQVVEIIERLNPELPPETTRKNRPYVKPYRSPDLQEDSDKPLGKAVQGRGSTMTEALLPPRPSDYGGCGLARSSLHVDLRDPSFIPRLEREFAEHIEGFKTKVISKSMKKQLDGNMLWRQLQQSKQQPRIGSGGAGKKSAPLMQKKIHGRKLADMKPDDRVEAMIKAGLI